LFNAENAEIRRDEVLTIRNGWNQRDITPLFLLSRKMR